MKRARPKSAITGPTNKTSDLEWVNAKFSYTEEHRARKDDILLQKDSGETLLRGADEARKAKIRSQGLEKERERERFRVSV